MPILNNQVQGIEEDPFQRILQISIAVIPKPKYQKRKKEK